MKRFFLILIFLFWSMPAHAISLPWGDKKSPEEFYEKGIYEESLKGFLDAQVKKPDDPEISFNLGNTYYRMQKYEEAKNAYTIASQSDKSEIVWQSHYNMGNVSYMQGKLEDAIAHYKKALEIKPEDEDTKNNLDFVRQEMKRRLNEKQNQSENPENNTDDQENSSQAQNQSQKENSQSDQQEEKGESQPQEQKEEQPEQAQSEPQDASEEQQTKNGQEEQSAEKPSQALMSQEEAQALFQNVQEGDRKLPQAKMRIQGRVVPGGKSW